MRILQRTAMTELREKMAIGHIASFFGTREGSLSCARILVSYGFPELIDRSARNAQPWRFIVVREQKMKEFIAKSIGPQDSFAKASAVIVVLGDQNVAPYWYLQDPMIAAEHLVLAATALGYGTCWIGALADWVPENTAAVKQALHIPEEIAIVCIITIGVADEKPRARPRNALREICYEEMYGKPPSFL